MTDRPILFSAPMVQALLAGSKTQTRRALNLPTKSCSGAPIYEHPKMGGWEATTNGGAGVFRIGKNGERLATRETVGIWHKTCGVCLDAPYQVGDRLYVREEYYQRGHWWEDATDLTAKGKPKWKFAAYDHDITFDAPTKFLKARSRSNPSEVRWYKRLGRFMPRRYSRLTLTVTDVRVERLQDCSEADAIAEGIERGHHPDTGESCGWKSYEIIHSGRHKGQPNPHAIVPNKSPVTSYAELWDSINGPGAWEANPWVVAVSFDVRQGNIDA